MLKKGGVKERPATAIIMAVIVAEDVDTKSPWKAMVSFYDGILIIGSCNVSGTGVPIVASID